MSTEPDWTIEIASWSLSVGCTSISISRLEHKRGDPFPFEWNVTRQFGGHDLTTWCRGRARTLEEAKAVSLVLAGTMEAHYALEP